MEQIEILRGIVAKLGDTEPDKIGPDFSLKTRALQGSVRRAALAAAIRRQLGVTCVSAYSVSTFGELEQAVFGKAPNNPGASQTSPREFTPAVTFESGLDSAGIRCGMDVEMISELPEAADYREHEFYRDSFSPEEIAYCLLQENPRMHFAARWCAKEALHKCDPDFRNEKMCNVEVVRAETGEVSLRHRLNGTVRKLPHALSISHTDSFAAAFVVKAASGSQPITAPPAAGKSVGELPGAATAPSTTRNSFTGLFLLAWFLAMAVALVALIRTFK
jgi:holo-[acyl-carrier protein] synthase